MGDQPGDGAGERRRSLDAVAALAGEPDEILGARRAEPSSQKLEVWRNITAAKCCSGVHSEMVGNSDRPVVLVVDDEVVVVDLLCYFLTQQGYRAVAAIDLDAAIGAARTTRFDAAVLDINLAGKLVYPAVDLIAAAGTPVIFASAFFGPLPQEYRHLPLLRKPISLDDLLAWLAAAVPSDSQRMSRSVQDPG